MLILLSVNKGVSVYQRLCIKMNEELSVSQGGQERELTETRCTRDVTDAGGVRGGGAIEVDCSGMT